jgi:hypothetical protein
MIVECRRVNQMLSRPPKTLLPSSASFAEIQIPEGASGLYYASHDVADCFYQFRIPKEFSRMLGLRPIRARDVNVERIDGLPVEPDRLITPITDVLPMGSALPFIEPRRPTSAYYVEPG